jgi:Flp pilus assembly protein TadG
MPTSVTTSLTTLRVWWRARCGGDPDRGSAALWLAITMVGMLIMAGLVLDGGAAIGAREQAADVAQQAARAGADALDPSALRAGNGSAGLTANPAAADRAARAVLDAAGVQGYRVSVAGNTVTVTASAAKPTVILAAAGITEVHGTATATAQSLLGTTTGG